MLISVIIPVYNGEKYIGRCLKSLINQKNTGIEFIVILDGCTDATQSIVEEYQKIDSRIKYFTQKNSGVSASRNFGISVSQGDFICFIDSDDTIEEDMYQKMISVQKEQKVDLVMCNISIVKGKEKRTETLGIDENIKIENIHLDKKLVRNLIINELNGSPVNKLYKKSIIEKYDIYFSEDIKIGEDYLFNLKYFGYIESVYLCKEAYYNYFINSNSAMTRYTPNKYQMYRKLHLMIIKLLREDIYMEKAITYQKIRFLTWIEHSLYEEIQKNFHWYNLKSIYKNFQIIINDEIVKDILDNISLGRELKNERIAVFYRILKFKSIFLVYLYIKVLLYVRFIKKLLYCIKKYMVSNAVCAIEKY